MRLQSYLDVGMLCELPIREQSLPPDADSASRLVHGNARTNEEISGADVSVHILAALVSVTVSYIIMSVRV